MTELEITLLFWGSLAFIGCFVSASGYSDNKETKDD